MQMIAQIFENSTSRILVVSAFLSLMIHGIVLVATGKLAHFKPMERDETQSIEIDLVRSDTVDVVDSFQETSETKPENPDFISSRDLSTSEQTSPDKAASNVLSQGNRGQQDQNVDQKQPRKKQPETIESFSLSQEELVALNDPLRNQEFSRSRGTPSQGFVDKLKKGEQLKVNALGLDYGQYIIRMRDRLASRWNPRRTIEPKMYSYSSISVQVAIVLNKAGELVDLKLMEGSFFDGFDKEALRAFKESAPFPNPPDSLVQEDGRVYMPWTFTLYTQGLPRGSVQ